MGGEGVSSVVLEKIEKYALLAALVFGAVFGLGLVFKSIVWLSVQVIYPGIAALVCFFVLSKVNRMRRLASSAAKALNANRQA